MIPIMKSVVMSIIILILSYSHAFSQSSSITIIELNNTDEYVLIKNEGETSINLQGWLLHDHDYGKAAVYSSTLDDVQLQPGEILQMQSGKKNKTDDDEQHLKLDIATKYIRWSDRNVWNDTCDIAYLLNSKGELIAEKHDGKDIEAGKKEDCR